MKTAIKSIIALLFLTTMSCKKNMPTNTNIESQVQSKPNYILEKPKKVTFGYEVKTVGVLSNKNEFQLSFMVGGIINYLPVNEGDFVKKGQVLARINQTSIKVMTERLTLSYEKAKRDYARVAALYNDKVVTLENLENAKTGLENTKLQLENAKFSKQHAVIKAPNSGTILSVLAQKNEMIQAGSPIIIMGSNKGGKVLKTTLADIDVVNINLKDTCVIQFDAFPNKIFTGYVSEISSSADRYTGMYPIEIYVNDKKNVLKSGFIGKVTIQSKNQKEYLQIPIEALVSADKMIGKINILKEGKKQTKTIKIARVLSDKLLIFEGVSENDTIILN